MPQHASVSSVTRRLALTLGSLGPLALSACGGSPPPPPSSPAHVVKVSQDVPKGAPNPTVASCPAGELVLSGGWTIGFGSGIVDYSARSGNGWAVHVQTQGTDPIVLGVYVLCLPNAPAGTQAIERSAAVNVPSSQKGQAEASCTSNEVAVGGGFSSGSMSLSSDALDIETSPNAWKVSGSNPTPGNMPLVAYAECLSGPGAHLHAGRDQVIIQPAGSVGTTRTDCPRGSVISGGGFSAFDYAGGAIGSPTTNATVYNFYPYNSSVTTWEVSAITSPNPKGNDVLVLSFALCLSFS